MIPGISNQLPADFQIDEKQISRVQAIIQSMTVEERHRPDVIDTSRRRRIAKGSGTSNADVKKLIADFLQMRKMMGQLTRMGPKELMKLAKR
jgi:signal recognition particle subunit SRP54